MSDDLTAKRCTPCRGGIPPLSAAQAIDWLAKTPGWALLDDGHRIERKFTFQNFAQAFEFVSAVAHLAETEDHHPDIAFGWGWATVSWQTKKIAGLHENDFIMAAKTNTLADA